MPKSLKKSEGESMERVLIALDCLPDCLKTVEYVTRVLKGAGHCEFALFHVLPTASPDKLRREEVQRIEQVHSARPDLAGYFWKNEDEKNMQLFFDEAARTLVNSGFARELISFYFGVESGDVAEIIRAKAIELGCSTVVLGRRRLSRVKEFLVGSVSCTVLRMTRGSAVWVVAI